MMENDQHSTPSAIGPISNVSQDILLEIFREIARTAWRSTEYNISRITDPSGLDTLRRTSQVCHEWRDIALNSSFLWGNVIDLDVLQRQANQWRMEVLRRSGNSLLNIRGPITGDDLVFTSFFVRMLDNHWSRIRWLECIVRGPRLKQEVWNIFQRPAPELVIFKLAKYHMENGLLFANHAPLLREFRCASPLDHIFLQKASFLYQLRELDVSLQSTPTHVLDMLSNMRSLEHLELRGIGDLSELVTAKSVYLPLLRTILLFTEFIPSLFLLKYIVPSKQSTLWLDTLVFDTVSDAEIDEMCAVICRYVKDYLALGPNSSDTVSFDLSYNDTSASGDFFVETEYSTGSERILDLKITLSSDNNRGPSVISKIVTALASCQYIHVTKLTFDPELEGGMELAQQTFAQLAQSAPSVKVLVATEPGFEALLEAEKTTSNLLPQLQELVYRKIHFHNPYGVPKLLLKFLQRRVAAGLPVTTLDIAASVGHDEKLDWGCLEAVDGLTVIMTRSFEYVCGSGAPEKLDWTGGSSDTSTSDEDSANASVD